MPMKSVKSRAVDALQAIAHREMSEDEFRRAFPLVRNRLRRKAAYYGCLFHPRNPPEVEFVRRQDPKAVWTIMPVERNAEELMLVNGFNIGYVGDFIGGYLVSKKPSPYASVTVKFD
jgi:hypothetical protein